ncbi:hypothetical protein M0R45_036425 [Rubus argutus]|uniref:Uncharacterized protein n=1 Tax=Rubus argutus TaxID=59490 RepID=A0AAW1W121_RUBAR
MPRTYVKMTCQVCKKQGHNRLGCPITKAAKAKAVGEGSSNPGQTSRKRPRKQASKENTNVKERLVRSWRSWKKLKEFNDSNQDVNAKTSTSQSVQQPQTQSSQNAVARNIRKSQFVQPGQASSKWAGF